MRPVYVPLVRVCFEFMTATNMDSVNESQTHSYGPISHLQPFDAHKTHATSAISRGFDIIFIHNEFLGNARLGLPCKPLMTIVHKRMQTRTNAPQKMTKSKLQLMHILNSTDNWPV